MMVVMAKWTRLTIWAIQSGEYTISKALLDESPRYTLWHGEEMVATRGGVAELKRMAEREVEHV